MYLDREKPLQWEAELVKFYCHGSVTGNYAYKTMHSRLYAIRCEHHLQYIYLDISSSAMLLLSLCKRGLKSRYGAPRRKIAVTMALLVEVYRGGWFGSGDAR